MTTFSIHLNQDEQKQLMQKWEMTPDEKLTNKIIKTGLLSQRTEPTIESKIKYQQYLKLCLQNWEMLKHSGHIMEEAKQIIIGEKQLAEPELNNKFSKPINASGFLNGFCESCKHYHAETEPRVCKNISCNCGVRG